MDSTKITDKDFVNMDMSPDFDYQTWSWKVYLFLCEKKVEHCVDLRKPIITNESTQEDKVKKQKWKKENSMDHGYFMKFISELYSKQFSKEAFAKKKIKKKIRIASDWIVVLIISRLCIPG